MIFYTSGVYLNSYAVHIHSGRNYSQIACHSDTDWHMPVSSLLLAEGYNFFLRQSPSGPWSMNLLRIICCFFSLSHIVLACFPAGSSEQVVIISFWNWILESVKWCLVTTRICLMNLGSNRRWHLRLYYYITSDLAFEWIVCSHVIGCQGWQF